ncbi:MAG: Spx/MgsR family RNA polymerase-binding regulatory protein [Proteobacteria bacterium]|nr:Spx/MgsR family RNA polymerase-binding regulatory protein [Pseudomonadota bacterium]
MITVYGLKNCDTCGKALTWLDAEGLEHRFHDVRKDGVGVDTIQGWITACGWETVLNKRGATWRGLDNAEKDVVDGTNAAALMAAHPALIKRPVFEIGGRVIVGFKDQQKTQIKGG